jgi:hypothetical protein
VLLTPPTGSPTSPTTRRSSRPRAIRSLAATLIDANRIAKEATSTANVVMGRPGKPPPRAIPGGGHRRRLRRQGKKIVEINLAAFRAGRGRAGCFGLRVASTDLRSAASSCPRRGRTRVSAGRGEAQRITAAIGIGLPDGGAATVETAARISLPGDRVVVKVSGPAHKTDRGGVQIVANNPEAITAAARQIAAAAPGEFLLAEYVEHPPEAEILAGVRWTEAFGPVVTIGPGGIGVGRGPDPAVIAPATSDRIEATLRSAPGIAPLIAGWRGSVPATTLADLAAVARALLPSSVAEMPSASSSSR